MNKKILWIVALLMTSVASAAVHDLATMKAEYHRPATIPYSSDNPYSKAKETLGTMLYFDPRLSSSDIMSCATCHNPSLGWSDGLSKGVGHEHKPLGRKTPTILNLAWDELFMWDGRMPSLEEQALGPIVSPQEMNMPLDRLVLRLQKIKGYRDAFAKAFPGEKHPITAKNIGKAIAIFERGVVSGTAPFDAWIAGDEKAISERAKKGFVLFNGKANCASCHSGWNFSDGSFHDIGLPDKDIGRGKFLPQIASMQHAFKTVGLRNIARRAPYMHDGSLSTLTAVIQHYNEGFIKRESLSDEIKPLHLSADEMADLIAFLNTLTSEDPAVTLPILPKKEQHAK